MVVKVSKPEINVREKLSELDYSQVPYNKMPAGSILQVNHDALTDNGVNRTVSNTTFFGSVGVTMYSKSNNSILLINIDTVIYRPSTSGEARVGYRYRINGGDWVFENSQWKYFADATAWRRSSATWQESFSYKLGDKIEIESAFINTVSTTNQFRTPSITVWEINNG